MGFMDCSISLRWNGTREQTEYVGTSTFIRDSYFFIFLVSRSHFDVEFSSSMMRDNQNIDAFWTFVKQSWSPFWVSIELSISFMHQITCILLRFFLLILLLDPNARKFPDYGITNVRETTEINNLSDICTTESSFLNLPVTCIDGISLQKEYHISGQTSSE